MQRLKTISQRRKKSSAVTLARHKYQSKCIVLFGATKTGKTSFIRQLLFGKYSDDYTPTIEDFHEESRTHKGYALRLEYIDTGGPFEFPAMRDMNIGRAHVAMILYDTTDESTMKVAATILDMISERRGADNPLHCVFVGTKFDMFQGEDRGDIYRIVDEYFKSVPGWIDRHLFVSSKNNTNITKALEMVLDHIVLQTPEEWLTIEAPKYEPKYMLCCCCCWKCCNKHME